MITILISLVFSLILLCSTEL